MAILGPKSVAPAVEERRLRARSPRQYVEQQLAEKEAAALSPRDARTLSPAAAPPKAPKPASARAQRRSTDRLAEPRKAQKVMAVEVQRITDFNTVDKAGVPTRRFALNVPTHIDDLHALYNFIATKVDKLDGPLLNPVREIYKPDGRRVEAIKDVRDGDLLIFTCIGDLRPGAHSLKAAKKQARVTSRLHSPKTPTLKLELVRVGREREPPVLVTVPPHIADWQGAFALIEKRLKLVNGVRDLYTRRPVARVERFGDLQSGPHIYQCHGDVAPRPKRTKKKKKKVAAPEQAAEAGPVETPLVDDLAPPPAESAAEPEAVGTKLKSLFTPKKKMPRSASPEPDEASEVPLPVPVAAAVAIAAVATPATAERTASQKKKPKSFSKRLSSSFKKMGAALSFTPRSRSKSKAEAEAAPEAGGDPEPAAVLALGDAPLEYTRAPPNTPADGPVVPSVLAPAVAAQLASVPEAVLVRTRSPSDESDVVVVDGVDDEAPLDVSTLSPPSSTKDATESPSVASSEAVPDSVAASAGSGTASIDEPTPAEGVFDDPVPMGPLSAAAEEALLQTPRMPGAVAVEEVEDDDEAGSEGGVEVVERVEDIPAPEVLTTASGNFTTVPEPEPLTSGELDGANDAEVDADDGVAVITAEELCGTAADKAPEEAAATDEVEAAAVAAQAIFRGSRARKALASASEESATVAAVQVLPVAIEVVDEGEGGVAVGATKPVKDGSSTGREDEQAATLPETGAENVDAVASASCAPASSLPKPLLSPTSL